MEIYEKMNLPLAARIDRVVAKKQFYDNGDVSSADRKLFDYVEKIYWRYALKTESTFIPTFADEERDYPEIEVMEVLLREKQTLSASALRGRFVRNAVKDKQRSRLAEVIMRSIPYPMLIFFQNGEKIQLWLGKLRQNQADSSRMTLTATEHTDWLMADDAFWATLSLKKMSTANFCTLYEAWFDTVSRSHLAGLGIAAPELSGEAARETVERLKTIEREMASLRSQMKKESQFNRKMELNTKLQQLKREQAKIMEQGRIEV